MFSRLQRFGLLRYKPVSDLSDLSDLSVSGIGIAFGRWPRQKDPEAPVILCPVKGAAKPKAGVLHS